MTPTLSTRPRHAALRAAPAAMALAMLAACGGGDDDGTAPPVVGAYTVGGALSGLAAGRTVTLQNNAENDLQLSANGSFEFSTRLDHGVRYAVTIKNQPAGQRCAVSQGTGTATANVRDVQVRCENLAAATFTVGGSVTGLSGTGLVLQNNGRDDLAVGANGGFTFATAQAGGTAYAVTVRTQPAGQSCTVANGTGTVASGHVTTVEVRCATAAAGLPEGEWKQELCVQARPGTWGRNVWRITRQSETRATAAMTFAAYANAQCTGTATVGGPTTDLGSFVFDRTGSTATLNAFWGAWNQPNGRTDRVVWARKGPRLCLMSDQNPTVFPTAAGVESYVDLIIPNKTCYVKD
ncbi:hypothetical protein [Acidovorax sp. FHTAMBA]|uniref:hypothetical protein n=1 Tax=Acidovorax sp. FHTAMBA TaxID=3140252 RepID=UPI0015F56FF4